MRSRFVIHGLLWAHALLWLMATTPAFADKFGGFSADGGQYLDGDARICTPLPQARQSATLRGVPHCERASAERIAAANFVSGTAQTGPSARYQARFRGTSLTITARDEQNAVLTWSALDPITAVTGVFLNKDETLLAVEYDVRIAGRTRTESIVFALPLSAPPHGSADEAPESSPETSPERLAEDLPPQSASASATDRAAAGPASADQASHPALTAAQQRTLARAQKLDNQRKARAAVAAYSKLLAEVPHLASAHYGLARNLARQRQYPKAIQALETLAATGTSDAIEWLVEARFDRAFAKLRADAGFRKAVGLDRSVRGAARRNLPLYERLLGFSSRWEQAEIKCDRAEVRVDFARPRRNFVLRVTSRCGGYRDATRLSGTWSIAGDHEIALRFPNAGGPDEDILCQMELCSGDEDCLQCGMGGEMSFTLQPVRR